MFFARIFTAALLAIAPCPAAQAQQSFATRPVRIIVPYPPGGGIDVLARALAPELSQLWGQPVVIDNVAGAGGIIGTEKVASAPGDGHTLLMATNPAVVGNRFLYKSLPYDPDRNLAPVIMVLQSGQMAVAHPSLAANTMKELVELARRSPGKIAYSSYGNGSQPHLFFESIAKREGVEFLHVPYKGIAPAQTAAVAGEVMLTIASPGQVGAMVKGGRLKALAIGAASRSREFPAVPTTAEAGFPYALSIDLVRDVRAGHHAAGIGRAHRARRRVGRAAARLRREADHLEGPRPRCRNAGGIRRGDQGRSRDDRRNDPGGGRQAGVAGAPCKSSCCFRTPAIPAAAGWTMSSR